MGMCSLLAFYVCRPGLLVLPQSRKRGRAWASSYSGSSPTGTCCCQNTLVFIAGWHCAEELTSYPVSSGGGGGGCNGDGQIHSYKIHRLKRQWTLPRTESLSIFIWLSSQILTASQDPAEQTQRYLFPPSLDSRTPQGRILWAPEALRPR